MRGRFCAAVLAPLWLLACGGVATPTSGTPPPTTTTQGGSFVITIHGFSFTPTNLQVTPGATVTVRNLDSEPHSVTSETAQGLFTPGSVAGVAFDTGPFQGEASFVIPLNAPDGTVIPFFCTVHKAMMANQAQLTVNMTLISDGGIIPPLSPPSPPLPPVIDAGISPPPFPPLPPVIDAGTSPPPFPPSPPLPPVIDAGISPPPI